MEEAFSLDISLSEKAESHLGFMIDQAAGVEPGRGREGRAIELARPAQTGEKKGL